LRHLGWLMQHEGCGKLCGMTQDQHSREPPQASDDTTQAQAGGLNHPGELARLQRRILLGLLVFATAWLCVLWPYSPTWALAGVVFCFGGYILVLALELIAMQWVNRRDRVLRATWRELLFAWVNEAWIDAQVFAWRQPFRPNAVPDQLQGTELFGQRGVVFVHGLVCNRGFWTPWLQRLRGGRHAFAAVNLEPVFGSISAYLPAIDAAVKAVTAASGLPPVLVCHSMGGLAARAWVATRTQAGKALPVHHMVSIGSPHRGTWLARFSRSPNAVEMREGSCWLAALNADRPDRADIHWLCWYSNCDPIVFPASTATLPGADNRLVRGAAHVQLAFLPEVMDQTLALLGTADRQAM
jgi:pimeloyl-ACP methyl ester carboxylesterase